MARIKDYYWNVIINEDDETAGGDEQ